jgi:indole-3-glycerol phosphate synthase
MKQNISPLLRGILRDTERETEASRQRRSLKRIKQLTKDAPPVLPFGERLAASGPSLIAEIKECSPSMGKMLRANVQEAMGAYRDNNIVKAISVLTNKTHFGAGMTVERMLKIKECSNKPVLRKDFITESYQIYEARAFGADAVLLMANILDHNQLCDLSDVAFELGMDVLFETHEPDELKDLPSSASVIGINSRDFSGHSTRFKLAKMWRKWTLGSTDASTKLRRLNYISQIKHNAVKIAESGVNPDNCEDVFSKGFNAALVGTSLLLDARGIVVALEEFECAIEAFKAENKAAIEKAHQFA